MDISFLRTASNGFLVFMAGWHAFSDEQNLLFISHTIEYLLYKAWREGVGAQRPMFSLLIYPLLYYLPTKSSLFGLLASLASYLPFALLLQPLFSSSFPLPSGMM
jgi:hypothetical protein